MQLSEVVVKSRINIINLIFHCAVFLPLLAMENNNHNVKKMPDLVPWQDAPKASKKLEGNVDFFLKTRSIMSLQELCLFGVAQYIKNRVNEKDLDFDQECIQKKVDKLISLHLDEQKFLVLLAEEIEPEFKVINVIQSNELDCISFCGNELQISDSSERLSCFGCSANGEYIARCQGHLATIFKKNHNGKMEEYVRFRDSREFDKPFLKVIFSPNNKYIALLRLDIISIITIDEKLNPCEWVTRQFSNEIRNDVSALHLDNSYFISCNKSGCAKLYVLDDATNEYIIQEFNISGEISDIVVNQNSSVMGFQHVKSDDVSIINWNECSTTKLTLGTLLGITLSKKLIATKDKKIKICDLNGSELNSFNIPFAGYETTLHRNLNLLSNMPAYLIRKIEKKEEKKEVWVDISFPSCSRPEYESRMESVTSQIHHFYVPQQWSLSTLYSKLVLMVQNREIHRATNNICLEKKLENFNF